MKAYKFLKKGALVGLVVGVLFIYVQPLYGMSALTDRHAMAYSALTNVGPTLAIIIAWSTHLLISISYGIITALILMISRNVILYSGILLFIAWLTTAIAAPASESIVNLVTRKSLPSLSELPPLNFQLDEKLALHLTLFLVTGLILWLNRPESEAVVESGSF